MDDLNPLEVGLILYPSIASGNWCEQNNLGNCKTTIQTTKSTYWSHGRHMPIIWDIIGKHFDFGHHMPTDDTCFGLLCAAEDFFIEGQMISRKTEIRKATNTAICELAWTSAESAAH
jgi:hypothetical protein